MEGMEKSLDQGIPHAVVFTAHSINRRFSHEKVSDFCLLSLGDCSGFLREAGPERQAAWQGTCPYRV
jgi:hypothetical protein